MSRPHLPQYSSPENTHFHPVFKRAIDELLAIKGLDKNISIISQFASPTGPVDFVLFDNATNRVILPIEIKRTQSSVRGLGRRQARDYWTNLGAQCQTSYYCASNLELTELFKYDSARPRTSAQRVIVKSGQVGLLSEMPECEFYKALIKCLGEVLDIIYGNIPFAYSVGLTQFQNHIEASIGNLVKWHQIFIPTCFEYIRGASSVNLNLKAHTKNWRPADFYINTPLRLNQLGQVIDFAHIFREPAPFPNDSDAFSETILLEAFESGKALGMGDDIAELVNEALAPSGLGIVETDSELAQLMSIISKVVLGRDLALSEEVLDPGSGSGRLLTALPITAFPALMPCQVRAVEVEKQFSESLCLRLGLAFANTISPTNSPKISITGIECIEKSEICNVKLVVMNPPFLSGVQAAGIKGRFSRRIENLSGMPSILDSGQIALEALFLELVWNLVGEDVVIATIFPIQHLHRHSPEVVKLRHFLAEKFALTHIVLYPSRGIFEGVTKQTVLLIGMKGHESSHVNLVEIHKQLGNVDFEQLYAGLILDNNAPTDGVLITPILRSKLIESMESGWKDVIGIGGFVNSFIKLYFSGYRILGNLPKNKIRRGTVGNGGNTKLTVFNINSPKYPSVVNLIPKNWLAPVLNTTNLMPRQLTISNAPEMSFLPPVSAYKSGSLENKTLVAIVDCYLKVPQPAQGSQARHTHSQSTVIRNLKSNQKNFGAGWVLIQRASRLKGEIGILEEDGILLSSNVPMVQLDTSRERLLLASWLLSIFGQLQFELYSAPQEGMRKLEMEGIKKVSYPDFSSIPINIEDQLISNFSSEMAIYFSNITPRPSDYLWAEIVDPIYPNDCLNKALSLLQEIVDERKGFGDSG